MLGLGSPRIIKRTGKRFLTLARFKIFGVWRACLPPPRRLKQVKIENVKVLLKALKAKGRKYNGIEEKYDKVKKMKNDERETLNQILFN